VANRLCFVQPGELIAAEDLQCAAALPDSLCELALADPEEIVTFVRQWAQTLSYGAEVRGCVSTQCSYRVVACYGVREGPERCTAVPRVKLSSRAMVAPPQLLDAFGG
jgi:hypothetical protein